MGPLNLTRRGILRGLSGLVVGFHLPGCKAITPPPDATLALGAALAEAAADLNAWIRVAPDGRVTLRMGAAEMGQGVYTSLPMILAEEMDADWALVTAESAPAHKLYRRESSETPTRVQLTGGSESVRGYYTLLREAGASARRMLVEAAAELWDVDPDDCATAAGVVTCGGRSIGYGELAEAASQRRAPGRVELKDPADFTLIGTSPPRLDIPGKTDGSATFGIDVEVPDALIGAIRVCPHYGGSLARVDAAAALAMPGVVDVINVHDRFDSVVVVADSFWRARQAAAALEIEWDPGELAGYDTDRLRQAVIDAAEGEDAIVADKDGKLGEPTLEARYEVPWLVHAALEPLSATAHVQADRCDVWTSTQAQGAVRLWASKIAGVKMDQVFVHDAFLGGGFGRRGERDFIAPAVYASKRIGGPVKVIWTREQMFARGAYRPAIVCDMAATVEGGRLTGWRTRLAGQNILDRFMPRALARTGIGTSPGHGGFSDTPYRGFSRRTEFAPVDLPITVGWWRSVQGSHNGFFRECFLDEVAQAAGRDPVELRRELLAESPRELATLELALAEAGEVPEGQHRGVAIFESFGSICAQVADVSVADGALTVHRVTAAIDCGQVIHPDTVRAQVMSGVGMGLSMTLTEGLEFEDGAVVQTNFPTHPLMTLASMPQVDVHIVPSTEPPGGVGEPGLPPTPGAVCNAIFNATGIRIRRLPIGDQLKA